MPKVYLTEEDRFRERVKKEMKKEMASPNIIPTQVKAMPGSLFWCKK